MGFLDLLSYFDWISPTAAIIEDVAHGGGVNAWSFFFSLEETAAAGWSPLAVILLLARFGCEPWGFLLQGDTYTIKVNLPLAQIAEMVLVEAGVPIKPESQGVPRV